MMVPCIVLGDSIAVGVAHFRPDCQAFAVSGISSAAYVKELLFPQAAQTLIISLGANDSGSVDTIDNLRTVRRQAKGGVVYWLMPGNKEHARAAIRLVAHEFGDRVIDTRSEAGPDHLHPTGTGYQELALLTQGGSPTEVAMMPAARPATTRHGQKPGRAVAFQKLYHAMGGS
jgi:lysophospholipase L1-like esterase